MTIEPAQNTSFVLMDVARLLRHTAQQIEDAVEAGVVMSASNHVDRDGQHPRIDRDGLSVHWRGGECILGATISFRLLDRLARRPNHYVSHAQLLDDVWECVRSRSAIRSAVCELRLRLSSAGMQDLAEMIDGSHQGHYGLILR